MHMTQEETEAQRQKYMACHALSMDHVLVVEHGQTAAIFI